MGSDKIPVLDVHVPHCKEVIKIKCMKLCSSQMKTIRQRSVLIVKMLDTNEILYNQPL